MTAGREVKTRLFMAQKKTENNPRLIMTAGTCIVIGVVLAIIFKNMRIGLIVGLIFGILGGSLFRRSTR